MFVHRFCNLQRYVTINFMHKILILLVSLLLHLSCSKNESRVSSFLKRPVTGEINGEDFEIKYAFIDPTIKTQNENDYVFILLPVKPKDACPKEGELNPKTPMVMVPAPKVRKKTFKLRTGTSRSMVFQYMSNDEQVAATAVKGKM